VPYISAERRQILKSQRIDSLEPETPGELNYLLTMCLIRYLESRRGAVGYTEFNDVLGALEGAKAEFYRRNVVPYEQAKIQTNGDVYA
jgi:hypothetical protein